MLKYIVKQDYKNRKIEGLPKKKCKIEIIIESKIYGDEIFKCKWIPFNTDDYPKNDQPAKGFEGTAKIPSGKFEGIGFHAWEQNDAEFIYYKVL